MSSNNGTGAADFQCNACGEVVSRNLGWKVWTPSYCSQIGRHARLYRISAPKDPVAKKRLLRGKKTGKLPAA